MRAADYVSRAHLFICGLSLSEAPLSVTIQAHDISITEILYLCYFQNFRPNDVGIHCAIEETRLPEKKIENAGGQKVDAIFFLQRYAD